jgi:hypothetical protein
VKPRFRLVASLGLLLAAPAARTAHAEEILSNPGSGWEVYTSGRIGGFVEVLQGDGRPQMYARNTDGIEVPVHPVSDGGVQAQSDPQLNAAGEPRVGPLLASRVRSGFLGNILTLGVRRRLSEQIVLTGQISIWGTTETDQRRTFYKNLPDEREGFIKVEGPGGSLLVGRALSLFSRGATEIDYLYGHGYGVGNPSGFEGSGPSGGHIGYGVLAPVFVAGVQYATPSLAGLKLSVGYFDPATLVGLYWERTKFGRVESELTYDARLSGTSKLHVFANGAYQELYARDSPRHASVYGGGAGARLEIGPFHLGVAGHYGKGLGLYYFLSGSDSILAQGRGDELRKFDGAYAQSQFVIKDFDFNLGWGITRVHQVVADVDASNYDTSFTPAVLKSSAVKSQMGISAVVVYHVTAGLHAALDYFRSDTSWWAGEKEGVNSFSAGLTLTW